MSRRIDQAAAVTPQSRLIAADRLLDQLTGQETPLLVDVMLGVLESTIAVGELLIDVRERLNNL